MPPPRVYKPCSGLSPSTAPRFALLLPLDLLKATRLPFDGGGGGEGGGGGSLLSWCSPLSSASASAPAPALAVANWYASAARTLKSFRGANVFSGGAVPAGSVRTCDSGMRSCDDAAMPGWCCLFVFPAQKRKQKVLESEFPGQTCMWVGRSPGEKIKEKIEKNKIK